jgi:hypothetical protein
MTDNEIRERLFSLFKQTDDLLTRVMSDGNAGIGGKERQPLLERIADNMYHARQRVSSAIAEIIMKEKAND